jgi:hypothetical protein
MSVLCIRRSSTGLNPRLRANAIVSTKTWPTDRRDPRAHAAARSVHGCRNRGGTADARPSGPIQYRITSRQARRLHLRWNFQDQGQSQIHYLHSTLADRYKRRQAGAPRRWPATLQTWPLHQKPRIVGRKSTCRILAALQRIGGRGHAAGGHQLDVRCAAPQLFPDGAPYRVHAIRNYGEIEMARATVIAGPKVALTAGLADGAAAVEQAALLSARKPGRRPRPPHRAA